MNPIKRNLNNMLFLLALAVAVTPVAVVGLGSVGSANAQSQTVECHTQFPEVEGCCYCHEDPEYPHELLCFEGAFIGQFECHVDQGSCPGTDCDAAGG